MRMHRLIPLILACVCLHAEAAKDLRGTRFIGFERFDSFETKKSEAGTVLISKRIDPGFGWDQLIASWNYRASTTNVITVEAMAIDPKREGKWYTLAKWSRDPIDKSDRSSVRGQRDEEGRVDTDVLKLRKPVNAAQIRITLTGDANVSDLKFVGLSFCDSAAERTALPPSKSIWGRILTVQERSQANYPEGISEWCSPTSMSMLMSFWAAKLNRPELDYDVPEVARGVHDPGWPGTGNWPFNTAFAGAHHGMRGYVTRFSDVSELEDWIEAGIPVAISVSYGYLKGKAEPANGHLVVCIGFDESGNIVVNDPGRSAVRQVYSRENLIKAWAESENTVYIVHPQDWKLPRDRFGHWFK
jgi:hypothetical protein